MDSPTSCYDVLILGDGPAGPSAALALARGGRSAILLSSGSYRNQDVAALHIVIGHDGESPEQFRAGAREQLRQKYPNTVMAEGEMIVQARQADFSFQGRNWKGFRLQSAGGNSFYGRKLIWAAGARDCFPEKVPGFTSCWISHPSRLQSSSSSWDSSWRIRRISESPSSAASPAARQTFPAST